MSRTARRRDLSQEEGQVFPVLLLVVVCLVAAALAFAQLGSAADQRDQTQTAADAAAVAATQELLRTAVASSPSGLPPGLAGRLFDDVAQLRADPVGAACDAADRNWSANPHRTGLSCASALSVLPSADLVAVRLTAPADEIAHGPAGDTSAVRSQADAAAHVVFDRCPDVRSRALRTALARRVVDLLVDDTAASLGITGPRCSAADQEPAPTDPGLPVAPPVDLGDLPSAVQALDLVQAAFRVELSS